MTELDSEQNQMHSFGELIIYPATAGALLTMGSAGVIAALPIIAQAGIAALNHCQRYFKKQPGRKKRPDECHRTKLSDVAFQMASSDPVQRTFYERLMVNLMDRQWACGELRQDDLFFIKELNGYDLALIDFLGRNGIRECTRRWATSPERTAIEAAKNKHESEQPQRRKPDPIWNYVSHLLSNKYVPLDYVVQNITGHLILPGWSPDPEELCYSAKSGTNHGRGPFQQTFLRSQATIKDEDLTTSPQTVEQLIKIPADKRLFSTTNWLFNAQLSPYGSRIYNLLRCPLFDEVHHC